MICTCCSSLSAYGCHELIHFGNYILDRSLLANYFAQSFGPFPAAINDHRGKRLYRQVLAKPDVAAVLDLAEPRVAASDDASRRIRPIPPLRRELAEFDPEGPARLAERGVEPDHGCAGNVGVSGGGGIVSVKIIINKGLTLSRKGDRLASRSHRDHPAL